MERCLLLLALSLMDLTHRDTAPLAVPPKMQRSVTHG